MYGVQHQVKASWIEIDIVICLKRTYIEQENNDTRVMKRGQYNFIEFRRKRRGKHVTLKMICVKWRTRKASEIEGDQGNPTKGYNHDHDKSTRKLEKFAVLPTFRFWPT